MLLWPGGGRDFKDLDLFFHPAVSHQQVPGGAWQSEGEGAQAVSTTGVRPRGTGQGGKESWRDGWRIPGQTPSTSIPSALRPSLPLQTPGPTPPEPPKVMNTVGAPSLPDALH